MPTRAFLFFLPVREAAGSTHLPVVAMPLSPRLRCEDFAGISIMDRTSMTGKRRQHTAFQSATKNQQSANQVPLRAFLFFLRLLPGVQPRDPDVSMPYPLRYAVPMSVAKRRWAARREDCAGILFVLHAYIGHDMLSAKLSQCPCGHFVLASVYQPDTVHSYSGVSMPLSPPLRCPCPTQSVGGPLGAKDFAGIFVFPSLRKRSVPISIGRCRNALFPSGARRGLRGHFCLSFNRPRRNGNERCRPVSMPCSPSLRCEDCVGHFCFSFE
jgi:hypothetical protein